MLSFYNTFCVDKLEAAALIIINTVAQFARMQIKPAFASVGKEEDEKKNLAWLAP